MRDFQSLASKQGKLFELNCLMAFQMAGFDEVRNKEKFPDLGIEVDAIFTNHWGIALPWEFKGSLNPKRPGMKRTDTVKKAICNGALIALEPDYRCRFPPLFVMTSHLPTKGDAFAMLNFALRKGIISDVILSTDGEYLQWLYHANEDEIQGLLVNHEQFGMTCHPHMTGIVNEPRKRKMPGALGAQRQTKAQAKTELSYTQPELLKPP